jgi:hypothetical protein
MAAVLRIHGSERTTLAPTSVAQKRGAGIGQVAYKVPATVDMVPLVLTSRTRWLSASATQRLPLPSTTTLH